jgi:hypothetical protein
MKRLFKEIAWYFRYRLFRKKTKLTTKEEPKNEWTFLEHDLSHPEEIKQLAHTSIALLVIRKHFGQTGRFTSSQLFFYIQLEGYTLTRKQVWRVIYKLRTIHLITKIVLCSNDPKSAPIYEVNSKVISEWTQEN